MSRHLEFKDEAMLMSWAYSPVLAIIRLYKAATGQFLDKVEEVTMIGSNTIRTHAMNELEMDPEIWNCIAYTVCGSTKDFEYLAYDLKITEAYLRSLGINEIAIGEFLKIVHEKQRQILDIIVGLNVQALDPNGAHSLDAA